MLPRAARRFTPRVQSLMLLSWRGLGGYECTHVSEGSARDGRLLLAAWVLLLRHRIEVCIAYFALTLHLLRTYLALTLHLLRTYVVLTSL